MENEKIKEGFLKIIEEIQDEGYTLEEVTKAWKEILVKKLMKD
jgi:outer membrane protein assembly factor BamA